MCLGIRGGGSRSLACPGWAYSFTLSDQLPEGGKFGLEPCVPTCPFVAGISILSDLLSDIVMASPLKALDYYYSVIKLWQSGFEPFLGTDFSSDYRESVVSLRFDRAGFGDMTQ